MHGERTPGRPWWPLAVGLLVAALAIAGAVGVALSGTGGHVAYVLDDAYMHPAVARELVESGTWGLNAGEFSTTPSSITWPILLAAAFLVTGPWVGWALVLAVLSAGGVLVAVDRTLLRDAGGPWRAATLVGITLLTPLPALVLHGMEHLLHAALAVWLVGLGAERLAAADAHRRDAAWLAVAAVLATATRYETLAVVLPLALALAARRRWWHALGISAGLLPPLAYGLVATAHGWPFLPIGAALKTGGGPLAGEGLRLVFNVHHEPLTTLAVAMAGLVAALPVSARLRWAGGLVFLAGAAQAAVGRFGEWGRYEAWLIVLALAVISAAAWELRRWRVAVGLVVAIGTIALSVRAWSLTALCQENVVATWRYPVQYARFVQSAYPSGVVGCTEAGAVSFYGDARVVDLAGLGHRGVAAAFLDGGLERHELGAIVAAEAVEVLPIIDRWMLGPRFGGVPAGWTKVAELRAKDAKRPAMYVIYAPDPGRVDNVRARLEAFAPALPDEVELRFGGWMPARGHRPR